MSAEEVTVFPGVVPPALADEKATRHIKPLDELGTMRKVKTLLDAQPIAAQLRILNWLSSIIQPSEPKES